MVSQSTPEKLNTYLVNNNLMDVFIFLTASSDNLRCRGNLLNENITDLSQGLQRVIQRISENPEISYSNREVSQMFKDLHYLELETIQRISIFIELFAVYYHIMRTNLWDLPRAIGKKDVALWLNSEFDYFKNQSVEDIQRNFKYPDINNFNELTSEEKKELKKILEESANMTLEFFKEIYHFNHNFRTVYNKYKHVMSEFTGVYGIDKERHNIQSHVYVRQKDIDKKNNPQYSVYVIPLSTETIQYFDKIARCVYTLLLFLLDNQLLSFANEGKDFIPRNLLSPEKGKQQRIIQITEKITSYCAPNLQSVLKVNPSSDAELQRKMNEAINTDHLYVMHKDILDIEFLKDSQITRSVDSETAENIQKAIPGADFEIVDVASASEGWSTYRLIDATILKVRNVLIKALRLSSFDEKGNPTYNVQTQTIFGVVPAKSVLGKQSAPFTQEELSTSLIAPDMKFEAVQEPWNKYVLVDGTEIEIKTVLGTVSKTNKYGPYGEPIYLTKASFNFKTNIPSNLRKT